MLTEDQGVRAIIALLEKVGNEESEERARANWRTFTKYEKENTEAAHRVLCGGFESEVAP